MGAQVFVTSLEEMQSDTQEQLSQLLSFLACGSAASPKALAATREHVKALLPSYAGKKLQHYDIIHPEKEIDNYQQLKQMYIDTKYSAFFSK